MKPTKADRGPASIEAAAKENDHKVIASAHRPKEANYIRSAVSEPAVQRKVSSEKEEEVQRKSSSESARSVSPAFQSGVGSAKASGTKMDSGTNGFMSSKFGADFSGVRIHTNRHASEMASEIGAKAFTHGNHIFFNQGEYQPQTYEGKKLIAHELTHTLQQGDTVQRKEYKGKWHEEISQFNYFMPYEIMMMFHRTPPGNQIIIGPGQRKMFGVWNAKVISKRKMHLSQKTRLQGTLAAASDEKEKTKLQGRINTANAMASILKKIATNIKWGKFPKGQVEMLKSSMGSRDFKSATEWKYSGKPCGPMTNDELIEILKGGDLENQIKEKSKPEWKRFCNTEKNRCFKSLDDYKTNFIEKDEIADKINAAFSIMGINTVKAQAVYLAHLAGESTNMLGMTEEKNTYMDSYRGGKRYRGRGAFHTTHRDGYVKTLAYMDHLIINPKLSKKERFEIFKASEAIKKDVKMAADPKYSFLFSAAYMHMARGVEVSGNVTDGADFLGKGPESSWVAGGDITTFKDSKKFKDRAKIKADVFKKALEVLRKKNCDIPAATPPEKPMDALYPPLLSSPDNFRSSMIKLE